MITNKLQTHDDRRLGISLQSFMKYMNEKIDSVGEAVPYMVNSGRRFINLWPFLLRRPIAETTNQCRVNVGPPSTTLAQHLPYIDWDAQCDFHSGHSKSLQLWLMSYVEKLCSWDVVRKIVRCNLTGKLIYFISTRQKNESQYFTLCGMKKGARCSTIEGLPGVIKCLEAEIYK